MLSYFCFKDMELNTIYKGDALALTKQLESNSINSVITSPPYWQLRDYGYREQWGLEPTYREYLEHLWSLMDEIWRVLKDDGTVWINLGDTYSSNNKGHGGSNSKKLEIKGKKNFQEFDSGISKTNISEPEKTLLLIPHRFGIGCIDRGWIMRNDIIWAKRNGMPESVMDRFAKKHEYFFFMTKKQKYYFDLDGIRDNHVRLWDESNGRGIYAGSGNKNQKQNSSVALPHPKGKNPGSVSDFWDIPTQPSSEKHYASYNTKLIDKPIIAGCPEGGIILDPFCGTGTTLARAIQLDRKAIGFDGSKKYCDIANKRINNELDQYKLFK